MTRWKRFLVGTLITIVLSVVATVRPQDVVKVSPETHTVLLENERVRVLDVYAKPGEKVGMHSFTSCQHPLLPNRWKAEGHVPRWQDRTTFCEGRHSDLERGSDARRRKRRC